MSDGFVVVEDDNEATFQFNLEDELIAMLDAELDALETADRSVAQLGGEVERLPEVVQAEEELPDISEVLEEPVHPFLTKEQQRDPFYNYTREPISPDQFKQYPRSVKYGPVKVAVYDLGTNEGLREYNRILVESDQANSPAVVIVANAMKETSDSWKVLVHYKEVWYKKTLK